MNWLNRLLGRGNVVAVDETKPMADPTPASNDPAWMGARAVGSTTWSVGLTPAKVASYLQQAGDGDPKAQSEILDEILDKDLHLVSVLGTRKRAVAGLPWSVVPASERRTDQRIAAQVQEVMEGITNLETAFVDLLDAVPKGYSACEIDWRQAPGRVWVEALKWRPQSWFTPDQDIADRWRLFTDNDLTYGEPLQPRAWIWHEAKARSGSTAAGSALGRSLIWGYLFKSFTLKDWMIFAEIYGAPIRVGKYRPGTAEKDLTTLFSALKALGVDAAAMIPEGTSIEFVQAASTRSSPEVYQSLISFVDSGFSKAVLGQTLTTEQGESGARALGQVHNDVRHDLLVSDALQLARTISRDLVIPLVDFQWGPQERYPRFQFQTEPPEDLASKAELYKTLKEIGVRLPQKHVHEVFGVPMPAEGEPVYGGSSQAVARPGGLLSRFGSKETPATDAVALSQPGPLPPLPAELEMAIRHALIPGSDAWAGVVQHLDSWLEKAEDPGQLSGMLVQAVETLDLQPLSGELADALFTGDLIGRVQVRQGDQPVGEWPKVPPAQAQEFWRTKTAMLPWEFGRLDSEHRARAFTCAQFTSLQAVNEVHQAIGDALAGGWSLGTFKDHYRAVLSANGMAPQNPFHIENVFRTNMGTAYSVGRYQEMRSPETLSERPFWRYDAIDDSRTRPTHREMDGKIFPANHPIWQTWYPPNGFQCRCMVHAMTAEEVRAAGLSVETEWPVYRWERPDGTLGPEAPNVPDPGFQRNPALDPHEFDFSKFPPQYLVAMGIPLP